MGEHPIGGSMNELLFHSRMFLDITITAFIIYQIYRLIAHTRTIPVVLGIFLLFGLYGVSRLIPLKTVQFIFETLSNYLIIGVLIVLQPELRRLFYRIGQTNILKNLFPRTSLPLEIFLAAVVELAETKTGALFVLVNKIGLNQIVEGGIVLNAQISRELLLAIFYEENPLHDGAVVIDGSTVLSAASYLPLSDSPQLKKTHGARHRSGLGISEESDALSVIVSEEKGKISVCYNGILHSHVDTVTLKSILLAYNNNRLSEEMDIIFKIG